jgi:hypothetical protein
MSTRYCLNCKRKTEFVYDIAIGHSICLLCGGWKAKCVIKKTAKKMWKRRKKLWVKKKKRVQMT